jgi:hypothetical protein
MISLTRDFASLLDSGTFRARFAGTPHPRCFRPGHACPIRRGSILGLLGQIESRIGLCAVRASPRRLARRPLAGRGVLESMGGLRRSVRTVMTPRRLLRLPLRHVGLVPARAVGSLPLAPRLLGSRRHISTSSSASAGPIQAMRRMRAVSMHAECRGVGLEAALLLRCEPRDSRRRLALRRRASRFGPSLFANRENDRGHPRPPTGRSLSLLADGRAASHEVLSFRTLRIC